MKENGKNISPDPEELSPLEKRGMCVYLQDVVVIAHTLKDLLDFFEKGAWEKSKKLSQKEAAKVTKEVAGYIYFETVKQIWEYQEGNLPENDAREVLDMVSTCFFHSYHIDLTEKREEYSSVENPLERISRNILRIVRGEHIDIAESLDIVAIIAGRNIYYLFPGIRRMFNLSEREMAEMIGDVGADLLFMRCATDPLNSLPQLLKLTERVGTNEE